MCCHISSVYFQTTSFIEFTAQALRICKPGRNDDFLCRHAYPFPLACCLWNLQSFAMIWGKKKRKTHQFPLLQVTSEVLSSPVHLKVFRWPKEVHVLLKGSIFISTGSEGGILCTLYKSIHSNSDTTRRGIQNDKLSEQLLRSSPASLMSKALSHERNCYNGAVIKD